MQNVEESPKTGLTTLGSCKHEGNALLKALDQVKRKKSVSFVCRSIIELFGQSLVNDFSLSFKIAAFDEV